MQNSISNQVALITGAGSGIGRALAIALSLEGVHVMLCARDEMRLRATAQICMQNGVKAEVFACDLTQQDNILALLDHTQKTFGGLDILINNAAAAVNKPVLACTGEDFDALFTINVKAPFLLCKHSIPLLRRSATPVIINISSTAGKKGYANQSLYSATKFALNGFSQALAQELFAEQIRVLLLQPGAINTQMAAIARPDLSSELLIDTLDFSDVVIFALTHRNTAVIDEFQIRRHTSAPFA